MPNTTTFIRMSRNRSGQSGRSDSMSDHIPVVWADRDLVTWIRPSTGCKQMANGAFCELVIRDKLVRTKLDDPDILRVGDLRSLHQNRDFEKLAWS
jgi:hypothetical protein